MADGSIVPLLKWPGGKRRLAPLIELAFSASCEAVYREPFVGAGAVFLHRASQGRVRSAFLSDINEKVVNFHRVVRDQADDLLLELSRLPVEQVEEKAYYDIRTAYNAEWCGGPRHAAKLLWLNKACYNGLFRENRFGHLNAAWNHEAAVSLPTEAHVRAVSALLQLAEIETLDFQDALARCGAGDHVYCDPPYLGSASAFTTYSQGGFDRGDHESLASMISEVRRDPGATVVVSGAGGEEGEYVYRELELHTMTSAVRVISRGARRAAAEHVWVGRPTGGEG